MGRLVSPLLWEVFTIKALFGVRFPAVFVGAFLLASAPNLLKGHDLRICNQSDALHPARGAFEFSVFDQVSNGVIASPTVLVNSCSTILPSVGTGPFTIVEKAVPTAFVSFVTATINYNFNWQQQSNGLLSSDRTNGSAVVFAVGGATTVVTFTTSTPFEPTCCVCLECLWVYCRLSADWQRCGDRRFGKQYIRRGNRTCVCHS